MLTQPANRTNQNEYQTLALLGKLFEYWAVKNGHDPEAVGLAWLIALHIYRQARHYWSNR